MQQARRAKSSETRGAELRHEWRIYGIGVLFAVICFAVTSAVLHVQDVNLRQQAMSGEILNNLSRVGAIARHLAQNPQADLNHGQKSDLWANILETERELSTLREKLVALDSDPIWHLGGFPSLLKLYEGKDYQLDRSLFGFMENVRSIAKVLELPENQRSFLDMLHYYRLTNSLQSGISDQLLKLDKDTSKNLRNFQIVFDCALFAILGLLSFTITRPLFTRLKKEHRRLVESEKKFAHLAHHDSLTELPNRTLFNQTLAEAIETARRSGQRVGLMVFDLDRFKSVNDTYGHRAGDAILKAVGERLPVSLRPYDLPTRLGGDEFAVIVTELEDPISILGIGHRIHGLMAEPVVFDGRVFRIAASIGCALFPDHADTAEALLGAADHAMYEAKGLPSRLCLFDRSMINEGEEDRRIESELVCALEDDQMVVYYQPKVDFKTGKAAGFEALIRWNHPEKGLIPPGRFLPVAERVGLMSSITHFVIQTVAADIVRWRKDGLEPGCVAVNMPEALLATDLGMETLRKAVDGAGISFSDIAIEVTEDVFLNRSMAQIQETVERLYSHGVRISFDDFGTGYAALTHLRTFPFDELKIDRTFISDLGLDPRCNQIVRSLIGLARNLGKTVVAEGVETVEQAEFLRDEGCDLAQGYLFGRPMPFEAITEFLMDRRVEDFDPSEGLAASYADEVAWSGEPAVGQLRSA